MLTQYAKPYPTIGEVIAGKNYDYVSYRGYDEKRNSPPALPDGSIEGEFCGCFQVVNGKIIPLDGDCYDASELVISSEEWTKPDNGIEKGLTIIVEMEFVPASEFDQYFNQYPKKERKKKDPISKGMGMSEETQYSLHKLG